MFLCCFSSNFWPNPSTSLFALRRLGRFFASDSKEVMASSSSNQSVSTFKQGGFHINHGLSRRLFQQNGGFKKCSNWTFGDLDIASLTIYVGFKRNIVTSKCSFFFWGEFSWKQNVETSLSPGYSSKFLCYCWWKNPVDNRINYLPTGARYLPSTVRQVPKLLLFLVNHWLIMERGTVQYIFSPSKSNERLHCSHTQR